MISTYPLLLLLAPPWVSQPAVFTYCANQLEGVKFLLFLYCHSLRSKSSQVEVLWEDHRNDLFINSFGESFTKALPAPHILILMLRSPHVGRG